ncbi:hypothetical protein ACS0TY_022049 [Phlomoides rotata]
MSELVEMSDTDCFDNLRLNREAFNRLCYLLRHMGKLVDGRYVTVDEQVALFLSVLSHHSKVRVVKFSFKRSGQTIHTYFHNVLRAVLKLHEVLLAKPSPVTDDCTHPSWKHFKGCLGVLDGTLIDVIVQEMDKARFSRRCTCLERCNCQGWWLRVPHGNFYLCDNRYPNGEGFLTPYKMVRYHLHEWGIGPSTPQNYKEYYNMHHSKARNVIERTFGLFKKRWAILRSPSFYPISVQNKIILPCAFIHNFIRNDMSDDPLAEGPMESGNTEQVSKPLRNINDKGRRGRSVREEQVLSEAMKKIVLEWWKAENGFKIGYLNLLSTYMKQVFPNTNLKPGPHINSCITVWKRNYHSLFEILKNTRVSLDSITKMIEATDEQWDAFMKKDPNARLMRSKSWPLYDDWCEIFDQSRATGEASVSHLRTTTPPPLFSANINVYSALNRVVGDETQDESQSPSGYAQTGESTNMGKTNSGRKRKSPLHPDLMVSVIQNFCDNALNRLGDIAQRIGHNQDMSATRKMIYSSISKMSMLTLHEKLRATALIARNAEDIDVFFSLPNPDRVEWVKMLLNGEI